MGFALASANRLVRVRLFLRRTELLSRQRLGNARAMGGFMKTTNRLIALAMASAFGVALAQSDWNVHAAQSAKKEELSESYRGSQKDNVQYQKVPPIKL